MAQSMDDSTLNRLVHWTKSEPRVRRREGMRQCRRNACRSVVPRRWGLMAASAACSRHEVAADTYAGRGILTASSTETLSAHASEHHLATG
jgi:hypothetical protein